LGECADFGRRSLVHAPNRVMELHNTSISVERVRRDARQHDHQADPKSQPDLSIRIERFRRIYNREEPRGGEGSWLQLFHVRRPCNRIRILLSKWHRSQLLRHFPPRTPISRYPKSYTVCRVRGTLRSTAP